MKKRDNSSKEFDLSKAGEITCCRLQNTTLFLETELYETIKYDFTLPYASPSLRIGRIWG